jgi:hypothetical protein
MDTDLVRLWRRADGLACYARKRPPQFRHRWEVVVRRADDSVIVLQRFDRFTPLLRLAERWRVDFFVPPRVTRVAEEAHRAATLDRDAGGDGDQCDRGVGDPALVGADAAAW